MKTTLSVRVCHPHSFHPSAPRGAVCLAVVGARGVHDVPTSERRIRALAQLARVRARRWNGLQVDGHAEAVAAAHSMGMGRPVRFARARERNAETVAGWRRAAVRFTCVALATLARQVLLMFGQSAREYFPHFCHFGAPRCRAAPLVAYPSDRIRA